LCGEDCIENAKADPDKALAVVRELKEGPRQGKRI
jgi:hypothetical protein